MSSCIIYAQIERGLSTFSCFVLAPEQAVERNERTHQVFGRLANFNLSPVVVVVVVTVVQFYIVSYLSLVQLFTQLNSTQLGRL